MPNIITDVNEQNTGGLIDMDVKSLSLTNLSNLFYEAKNNATNNFIPEETEKKEDYLSDIIDITKENMLALNVKPGSLKEVIELFNSLKTNLLDNPAESLEVQGHLNPQTLIEYL